MIRAGTAHGGMPISGCGPVFAEVAAPSEGTCQRRAIANAGLPPISSILCQSHIRPKSASLRGGGAAPCVSNHGHKNSGCAWSGEFVPLCCQAPCAYLFQHVMLKIGPRTSRHLGDKTMIQMPNPTFSAAGEAKGKLSLIRVKGRIWCSLYHAF